MKRIISMTLAVLMLAVLVLTAVSCDMEGMSGFTRLRDHIAQDKDKTVWLGGTTEEGDLPHAYMTVKTVDDVEKVIVTFECLASGGENRTITLTLDGDPEKAHLTYKAAKHTFDGDAYVITTVNEGEADVLLTHYTGSDPIEFTTIKDFLYEQDHRKYATNMLNSLLLAMDQYTTKNLDMDLHEVGFLVLADKYMAPKPSEGAEEDLGGFMSSERLVLAGQMLLMGMGMVFLVLAILWIVLLIFKAVFAKDPAEKKPAPKAEKAKQELPAQKAEAPKKKSAPAPAAPAAPVAPAAPAADDGQLIAVITAAVAAAIESDPALSSQFASGFRVVSFKKTEKTRNR